MSHIKEIRENNNLTQSELAKKINVSQQTIAKWESGISSPRADKLPEIARILNCKIEDLF